MSINDDLLSFSGKCPTWQQDLIRRICTQPDLTESDIQDVLANLRSTQKLCQSGTETPLQQEHLSARTSSKHVDTTLQSVGNVKNANLLAPNQVLPFTPNGITLIFGYNGSGKTGYSRIMKQICRARRDRTEPILGNAYSKTPSGPASAKISYVCGATTKEITWTDGQPSPSELSRISVFDAETAPLYADKQNKIEFLPLGLDVLPRLGRACESLAKKLDESVAAVVSSLNSPLPVYESEKYREFVNKFSISAPSMPTIEEITDASNWNEKDEEGARALEKQLREASEPAALSAQYKRVRISLDNVKSKVATACAALDDSAVEQYKALFDTSERCQSVARIAAAGQFENEPLGEFVGSEAWRDLYKYAEAFSADVYPGEEFPSIGPDRVCPLCQQSLSREAESRLQRFRAFVHDNSQKDADNAVSAVRVAVQKLTRLVLLSEVDIEIQLSELVALKTESADLVSTLKTFVTELKAKQLAILDYLAGKLPFGDVKPFLASPLEQLATCSGQLESDALRFDQLTTDSAVILNLKQHHQLLQDKKKCNADRAMLLDRQNRLTELSKLRKCKVECDTTAISRMETLFRKKYLTAAFKEKILDEAKFLGLDYLPITVDDKTERGTSYIGVALNKSAKASTSKILSEGEFRGLALACFFAEIGNIEGHDGIIIDDPVSSLDHLHTEQVAKRLVREAKSRSQVIVLTHDLPFYYELWTAAAQEQVPVHRNWVYSGEAGFGTVTSGDGPWQVKRVKERLGELEKRANDIPNVGSVAPEVQLRSVEHFYTGLRETWERLVEEHLLGGVVGRFQPSVNTQSLKDVSVTDDDYAKVFFAMKKASEFSGHDRPQGRRPASRTKEDAKTDLKELRDYEETLKKRKDELSSRRRLLEQPPKAMVAPSAS
jgi:energy-coupling factor transporter ATP-binding protein EcfA2